MTHLPVVVRCEPDPQKSFHADALAGHVPGAREVALPGEASVPPVERIGAAVITGSSAGVYEDRPWIDRGRTLVRELVGAGVPTLGVCFGHQLVNDALGGHVKPDEEFHAGLVAAEFRPDPLFRGVSPVVPALHGDIVTEPGAGLDPIARADHCRVFGTRHRSQPVWTVQFHPELDRSHRDRLAETGWEKEEAFSFEQVTAARVIENFLGLARAHTRP